MSAYKIPVGWEFVEVRWVCLSGEGDTIRAALRNEGLVVYGYDRTDPVRALATAIKSARNHDKHLVAP